jgi:hypothetical protein
MPDALESLDSLKEVDRDLNREVGCAAEQQHVNNLLFSELSEVYIIIINDSVLRHLYERTSPSDSQTISGTVRCDLQMGAVGA